MRVTSYGMNKKKKRYHGSSQRRGPVDPNKSIKDFKLKERTVAESALQIVYPFTKDKGLLNSYLRFDGGVRVGKLLEDMDAFSGNSLFMLR